MPFGTYITFVGAGIYDTNYYNATENGYTSQGARRVELLTPPNHPYSSANSGVAVAGVTVANGLYFQSSTASGSNYGEGETAYESGTSSFTENTSTSSSQGGETVFSTSFVEDVGFKVLYTYGTDLYTQAYDFTDPEVGVFQIGKITTTRETNEFYPIRSAIPTTLTLYTLGTATTYTDVTSTTTSFIREATVASQTTTYGTGVGFDGGEIFCNSFSGVALVIQPEYGFSWTQDGNYLQYLELFTSTGSFSAFYSSIIKDNDQSATTFQAESSQLIAGLVVARPLGSPITTTIISGSTNTIIYDIVSQEVATVINITNSYSFDGTNFKLDTDSPTSYGYSAGHTVSTSTTQIIANEVADIIYPNDPSGLSVAYYTTTKAIQALTTTQFFTLDAYLSYFSSFSYRGLVQTTSEGSYVLFEQGDFGSQSLTYLNSTSESYSGSTEDFATVTGSYGYFASGFQNIQIGKVPRIYYKSFYSLQIPPSGSRYYTQMSPAFRFVVGSTSDSIGGYKKSLSPDSALTKIYFTTYNFERGGALGAPIIAVPIDFTSESTSGTTSSYTYQAVSIPSGFYIGSANASVYWTKLVAGSTTNTTESFAIGYAGDDLELTMGYYGGADEFYCNWSPIQSPILYTQGLVHTSSGATWSTDGYYYWSGSDRVTSMPASNAINPIGDGVPITYIGSEWVEGFAFPVVSIVKQHINSY